MIGMQQIHGNNIVRVTAKDDGKNIENCDALISNDPKVKLYVKVADCLPISVIDKKSHSFGLIHAGWRGLDNKIITKTIKLMVKEFSSNPEDLDVSIGPHICQKHYEVKNDVSDKFAEFPEAVLKKDGKEYLDLAKIAELQLISVGVKKENIRIDNKCTFEDDRLFSYRRGDNTNRNIYTLTV
jgi:YfiH family protein